MRSRLYGVYISILIIATISPFPHSQADNTNDIVPIHSIVSHMKIGIEEYQGFSHSNISYSLRFHFVFTIFNELNNSVGITYNAEIDPPVYVEYNFADEADIELTGIHTSLDWVRTKITDPGTSTTPYTWILDLVNYDKPVIPDGSITLVPYKLYFGEKLKSNEQNTIEVNRLTMTAFIVNSTISYIQDTLKLCNCHNFFETESIDRSEEDHSIERESTSNLIFLYNYTFFLAIIVSLASSKRNL